MKFKKFFYQEKLTPICKERLQWRIEDFQVLVASLKSDKKQGQEEACYKSPEYKLNSDLKFRFELVLNKDDKFELRLR